MNLLGVLPSIAVQNSSSLLRTMALNDTTLPTGSRPIIISGTVPGLLDLTQPARLLRHPTNRLFFASYDPLTAATSDQRRLPMHNQPRSDRVVIEMTLGGESFWRFVPDATLENGCVHEGHWPRVVYICGYAINVPFTIKPKYFV